MLIYTFQRKLVAVDGRLRLSGAVSTALAPGGISRKASSMIAKHRVYLSKTYGRWDEGDRFLLFAPELHMVKSLPLSCVALRLSHALRHPLKLYMPPSFRLLRRSSSPG